MKSSFEPKLERKYWRKYFVILTNFEVKMNDDIIIKKISSFFQYFERTIASKETNASLTCHKKHIPKYACGAKLCFLHTASGRGAPMIMPRLCLSGT